MSIAHLSHRLLRTALPRLVQRNFNTTSSKFAFSAQSLLAANMSTLPHQTTDDSVELQQKEVSDLTKLPIEKDGSFNRKASTFRNFITQDGDFTPEKGTSHHYMSYRTSINILHTGRYHLYVSYGCRKCPNDLYLGA